MSIHLFTKFEGHGPCCQKLQANLEKGVLERNGTYLYKHKDGSVEYASIRGDAVDKRFTSRKESSEAVELSGRFVSVIFAVFVFLATWCLDILGLVVGLSFWVNVVVLGVVIAPYVWELSKSEISAILGVVFGLVVLVLPMPIFFQIATSLVVTTMGFYRLVSPSKNTYLLPVLLSQIAVACLFTLSPSALLLAPLPIAFTLYKARSEQITCKFALTFSVLAMLGAALTAHFLGIDAIICLHDAVLATVIMFAKDMAISMYVPKSQKFTVGSGPEIVLEKDVKVLDCDRDLIVRLDGVRRGRVSTHRGGEIEHSLEDFSERVLPAGAFVKGKFIGENLESSRELTKGEERADAAITDLDSLVSHLVPAFMVASLFSGIWVWISGAGFFAGAMIAMKTLVAGCPCVFLVLPYLEKRMSDIYSRRGSVTFNFRAKILSAYNWPSMFENFTWLFDRTRTTHFPQEGSSEYVMHPVPKEMFACLRERGSQIQVISGSGAHFSDQVERDFEGAEIYINPGYCCRDEKTKQFDQVRKAYTIMAGDGDNDAGIMSNYTVLGVGVNPHPSLQGRYTIAIYSWDSWTADGIMQLIKVTLSAQKFASRLLVEILSVLAGMIALPVGAWQFGIAIPIWAGCVSMIGSMAIMTAQIEYYHYKHQLPEAKCGIGVKGLFFNVKTHGETPKASWR